MTSLLLSILLGGYSGCGDCCGRYPVPADCMCSGCYAEKAPPLNLSLLPSPEAVTTTLIKAYWELCEKHGGFFEFTVDAKTATPTQYRCVQRCHP